MDRLDDYITRDWRDDGFECYDADGEPYPEHNWPDSGGACRYCDASNDE